jgi:hypothetical protein
MKASRNRQPTGNRMATHELITALGEAPAASWGKLPAEVQQALFEAAIGYRRRLS